MAELQAQPTRASSENMIEQVYVGTAENTFSKSGMVPDSYKAPYNPDDLWQKTGDYSIYEDMINDDQVSICLQLKKDLIIGSGFEFMSEGEDQEEIVEFLSDSLDDSCLIEGLEEILTAYENGFSLTEKIFDQNEKGMTILKDLKTRHPNTWLMHTDDKGHVTKYEQNTHQGYKDIDPKSLIHFINSPRYQNPYGQSDLRPCYAAWFAKRQVIRYYGIFLEKAASPTPIAKYDKNAPIDAVTKIFNTIKKLQASTAMAIPKEIEVEFLESKSNGEAYSKAINIFNMFIGRSLFIPDLLGLTGSETGGGSYSLGKEQIGMFFMHITRRRAALEKAINEHIIWPMIVSNFGFVDNYPKFKFKPLDDMKAIELAKVWLDAVKSKVFPANEEEVNYFRSLCKFPEGEVGEVAAPVMPGIPGQPSGAAGAIASEDEDDKAAAKPGKDVSSEKEVEKEVAKKPKAAEKKFGKIYNLPPGDYYKKCDYKKIDTKFKDYDNSVMTEVAPIIKKQIADIIDQIQKKNILKSKDISRIDSLKFKNLKDIKLVLKSSFTGIYKDGQAIAQTELMKNNFAKPVTSAEFLRILEEETFQYIGDYQYSMMKKIRQELIAAIKDGTPLSEVINEFEEILPEMAQTSIERYSRTKHTETMNQGRLAFFEESGIVAAYQFSAILDDVTSPICSGLNGKIFKAGEEAVPPLHFNCRSLLIPITKYEEFKVDEKVGKVDINDFIEENKGTGFSKFTIKITDPGVEFITEPVTETSDETIYSLNGKPFQSSLITYKTKEKLEIKSVSHARLDDGPTI